MAGHMRIKYGQDSSMHDWRQKGLNPQEKSGAIKWVGNVISV